MSKLVITKTEVKVFKLSSTNGKQRRDMPIVRNLRRQ